MKKVIAVFLFLASPVVLAESTFNIVGKVTAVEASYLPGKVTFQMETGHSVCPSSKWLKWEKNDESNKIVYSTLMTALVSDKSIRLYINEGDDACSGRFIHLVK
ncbi:hypothetical protein [Endozoicomonas sp. ALD040]|uniref:hypothetical protein n=1 Tax=Endozoicomonas sp. ALD040 TaxID=3403079 RepID=UPI003BB18709